MSLPGRSACSRDSGCVKARKCAGSLFFSTLKRCRSLVFDKSVRLREVERARTTSLQDRFLSEHGRTRLGIY
jgi:hypothetical protein